MVPMHNWFNRKIISMVGGTALFRATLAGAGWFLGQNSRHLNEVSAHPSVPDAGYIRRHRPPAIGRNVFGRRRRFRSHGNFLCCKCFNRHHPASRKDAHPSRRTSSRDTAPSGSAQSTRVRHRETSHDRNRMPRYCNRGLQRCKLLYLQANHGNVAAPSVYTDDMGHKRMELFLVRAQRLGNLMRYTSCRLN